MKKVLFIFFSGLLFLTIACNAPSTVNNEGKQTVAQRNIAATKVVNDAFGNGDVSKLDSVIATDFVDHTDRGDIKGVDSLKAMIAMVRSTNKDMDMKILREVADSQYVFQWMRFTGVSDGKMMPAGPYDMTAIQVVKFNDDGKAVEHWEFMEPREMMKMMANTPQKSPEKPKK
jgi:predicted SnoaL-like aldol condensation-catalyzing enzyme